MPLFTFSHGGKMKKPILLLLVFSMSPICMAGTFSSPVAAKEFTENVMSKVATGDIEGGLKMMKPYTIIPEAEFDAMIIQAKLQLPAITQRFGKSIGKEFVREDKVGDSLVRIIYLHKFELHPMQWTLNLPRFRGHLPKVDNTEIGGIHVSPETT
jgi:hypothetical protein